MQMLTHTHSKSKHAIIFICGIVLGGTIIFNTIFFCCLNDPKVKTGQFWKYNTQEINPFNSKNCNVRKVIDVKNNYVLFVNQKNDTLSLSIKNFKHKSTLISEEK